MNLITTLKTQLKSSGLRQSVSVAVGNALASVISAATIILISRHLGPQEFGVFSASIAFMLLAVKIVDFGLNVATQRFIARSPGQAQLIGNSVFYFKMITAILLIIIGIMSADEIAIHWLHFDDPYLLQLTLILSGISLLYEYSIAYLNAIQSFYQAVIANFIQAGTKVALMILLVKINSLTTTHAITFYALAPLTALIYNLYLASFSFKLNLRILKKHLGLILPVAKFVGISIVALAAADNIDIIFIKYFLTSEQTGLYAAAAKIALFFNFMAMSFLVVMSVRVARYQTQAQVKRFIKRGLVFSLLAFLILSVLVPLARYLLVFTSGPQYLGAIPALRFLIIAAGFTFATVPFYALFYLFPKPQFYSYYGLLLLSSLVIFDLSLIPLMGINGAALAQLIMRLILFIFTLWYALKAAKQPLVKPPSHEPSYLA